MKPKRSPYELVNNPILNQKHKPVPKLSKYNRPSPYDLNAQADYLRKIGYLPEEMQNVGINRNHLFSTYCHDNKNRRHAK